MAKLKANGIEICYDEHGDPADPPLLLIMGLSAQMTSWPDRFVAALAGHGLWVIRFDNRDIGLSTWLDEAGVPDLAGALATGTIPPAFYTLSDMAGDAAGLLDGLGIDQAHIVGASMGGMIAQTFAIEHPERTLSLTSIFSTTGDPGVGQPQPGVAERLFLAPAANDRDSYVESWLAEQRLIGSPAYPGNEADLRATAAAAYDRAFHPAGVARQVLAVVHQPDRTEALRRLECPTLVIHGEADPLVDVSGGRACAGAVPGAELWTIAGMGHDLPPALEAEIVARIAAHCLGGGRSGSGSMAAPA